MCHSRSRQDRQTLIRCVRDQHRPRDRLQRTESKEEWLGRSELLLARFVADAAITDNDVRHGIVIVLRTADAQFANFHTLAIYTEASVHRGHDADGKSQDNESPGLIDRRHPAALRTANRYDWLSC